MFEFISSMRTPVHRSLFRLIGLVLVVSTGGVPRLRADVVETTDGSTIRGTVIASDSGFIKVDTEFAGTVVILKDHVKAITTDEPIHVALADGNTINGRIVSTAAGLQINSEKGGYSTEPGAIAALWRDGDKSPAEKAADALRRKWAYEFAFDLNGRGGNSDRTFLGLSGRAVLQGALDRLMFYGNFSHSDENGEVAQDEAKGGIDYSSFFSKKLSWYVRSEVGYDHTKDLDLRSQSATGVGYSFIKTEDHKLEGRFGLNYRFENYGEPENPDFASPGIDLGLLHTLDTKWGRLTQSLTLTPSFQHFSNYVFIHDSALELPVSRGNKPWRIRLGIKTDYTSDPPDDFKRLDWTYYTQLVLTLK